MASNAENVYQFNKGQQAMPSKNGYIRLWRDIKKQPFYKDFIARGMFTDMLLDAQHKSRRIEVDGVTIFLNPGQLFTKRKHFVDQGVNDSKVKRVLQQFEDLGIIRRETIKKGKRSIGQRVTFANWQKWQKTDQSSDQSSDQPQAANSKGSNGGCDQCPDQSSDQENNNVSSNNDLNAGSLTQRECQEIREKAYAYLWKHWLAGKKLTSDGVTGPKAAVFTDRFVPRFSNKYINEKGVDFIRREISAMGELIQKAFADLHEKDTEGKRSSFDKYRRMEMARFIKNNEWEVSEDGDDA